jgi:uncharacterized protein (TIGR02594 family)
VPIWPPAMGETLRPIVEHVTRRRTMDVTAYWLAERYVGTREIPGTLHHPAIMAMLTLDMAWPESDEVPWCSAFVNWIAWHLRLPRSKSLLARSWLGVGTPVQPALAEVGFDVVVLQRGSGQQPGPEDMTAPGHVGLFAGLDGGRVLLLGGNQADAVNVSPYSRERILGIRRLLT